MASLSFTVADEDVPRIVATFEHQFGVKGGGESNSDFIKRHIADLINRWTKTTETDIARKAAIDGYVDIDIS